MLASHEKLRRPIPRKCEYIALDFGLYNTLVVFVMAHKFGIIVGYRQWAVQARTDMTRISFEGEAQWLPGSISKA